jgi:acetoin utilization protein AcuB
MTRNPITVKPDSDPLAAVALCHSAHVRRLPVVNPGGQVIGIVSRGDLDVFLSRAPSPGVMRRQHRVEQMMKTPVITATPDDPMEEAARLMVEHKIGSLPVVQEGRLVGIITETDIFKQFVGVLGGQTDAVRLTISIPDVCGQLAQVVSAIANLGCNIHSVVLHRADPPGDCYATLWVHPVDRDALIAAIRALPEARLVRVWSK